MVNSPLQSASVYGVNVKDFGACGDGVRDDSQAIQRALDSGRELVVIPYGIYKISQTLRMGSDTRLRVHPQTRLFLADHAGATPNTFLITNKHHDSGARNITVEGGIWDGNNVANPRGPDRPDSYTGVLINFSNVDGLTLRGLVLRDSESYFVRFGKVTNFLIEDLTFEIRHLRPNQDGIHVSGFCEDGVIRHLRAHGPQTPNDDMVALVADDALGRAQNLGAFNGPIRRVRVEDIQADSCHSFVRLLSYQSPIEDIEITDVRGGCRCCAINMDACRDCRVKLFDEADYPQGVGHIARVRVQKMHVYKASDDSHQPLIDLRTRVHDFVIEDFRRDARRDVSPATPTLRAAKAGHIDLTLEGLTAAQLSAIQPFVNAGKGEGNQIASVIDEKSYRTACQIAPDAALELPQGGFAVLHANRSATI